MGNFNLKCEYENLLLWFSGRWRDSKGGREFYRFICVSWDFVCEFWQVPIYIKKILSSHLVMAPNPIGLIDIFFILLFLSVCLVIASPTLCVPNTREPFPYISPSILFDDLSLYFIFQISCMRSKEIKTSDTHYTNLYKRSIYIDYY